MQLVVLDIPVHVGFSTHILVQLKVPAYEVGVGLASEKALNYVIHALVLSHQPQGLGAARLLAAVGIGWVAVADKEAELLQGRHLAPRQVLEYLALGNGVIEIFALLGAYRNLREASVYLLLGILLRPRAAPVLVAYIYHIPTIGQCPSARYAAVLSDNISAPQHQRGFRDGARRVKCPLGPLPFLV